MAWRRMFVDTGTWNGTSIPRHARVYVELVPASYPHAVVAIANQPGAADPWVLNPADVSSMDMAVDQRQYYGVGLAGLLAAGISTAIDGALAPWSLEIQGYEGFLHLSATGGPAPSDGEWAEVGYRLRRPVEGLPVRDFTDPEPEAGSDAQSLMHEILVESRIGPFTLNDSDYLLFDLLTDAYVDESDPEDVLGPDAEEDLQRANAILQVSLMNGAYLDNQALRTQLQHFADWVEIELEVIS